MQNLTLRTMIVAIWAAGHALAGAEMQVMNEEHALNEKPNMILIVSDNMG